MKVLMLTPYLPYPTSTGGHIRSYNLIKRLARRHEITLVCFTREHNTSGQVAHMKKLCKKVIVFERGNAWTFTNILRTGFSPYPFLVMIYYTPFIKQQLSEEIKNGKYNLIHVETFYVMPYLPEHKLPVVLVEQTIMSRVFGHYIELEKKWWMKPLMWIDVAKIRYWERRFWEKADRLVAVSNEDASVMKKMVPKLEVRVVPNGVGEDFNNIPPKLHYNHTILYMGNYKWIQNREAAQILATEVFPIIKRKIPDAKLIISGQFQTSQLKSLSGRDISVIELADDDGRSVVKSYQKSGLLVAPIYGPGGTRLKILAAMASMVPVVTTPIGAEGYGVRDGESILIGKTPRDLADKSILVLEDISLYRRIALSARKLVDTKFSWEPIAKDLETIYKEMVNAKK